MRSIVLGLSICLVCIGCADVSEETGGQQVDYSCADVAEGQFGFVMLARDKPDGYLAFVGHAQNPPQSDACAKHDLCETDFGLASDDCEAKIYSYAVYLQQGLPFPQGAEFDVHAGWSTDGFAATPADLDGEFCSQGTCTVDILCCSGQKVVGDIASGVMSGTFQVKDDVFSCTAF